MKSNKQVKKIIESSTGGVWSSVLVDKPELHHLTGTLSDGLVWVYSQLQRYHKVVSIKAIEFKQ